jgi:hypothetical protein
MKFIVIVLISCTSLFFFLSTCSGKASAAGDDNKDSAVIASTGNSGFESQVKYGEHLIMIAGCNDCHTPKKMGPAGPEPDPSLTLSGHPAAVPAPDVNRKEVETKGLGVTNDLTVWVGPWGISYAANITSDSTGIGLWSESQFILCMRKGKWKGVEGGRTLLPPMPWQSSFQFMTDDELKAILAYLKTTTPVKNVAPEPSVPVLAAK